MKRTTLADPGLAATLAETLRQGGPLAGLDADVLAKVLAKGELIGLSPGEALIREGDAATPEVYVLIEGALVVQSQSGVLARLNRPGDVVGEVAVVLSSRRTADVVADGAARVIAIPSKLLELPELAEVAAGIRSTMLRDDWVRY